VFKAQSTFDNRWLSSDIVTQAGLVSFVVGNKLLNVTVTDGIGNTPLANQEVIVMTREPDGGLKWFRRENTDGNGKLSLDLPGLGTETVYVLRTTKKHGSGIVYSSDIQQTGNHVFKVGNVRVKAVNGQTGGALAEYRVNAYVHQADGKDAYVSGSATNTDANGFADFDLPELGNGTTYVFKAQSTFDNRWLSSDIVTQAGLVSFVVGNKLLNVAVSDGIGNTPLANQEVIVMTRESDGGLKWFRREHTDANGQLSLDLPGLGNGTDYVLRTTKKHGSGIVYSSDIQQTGNHVFKVGNVRVKAVNGQTGGALAEYRVNAYVHQADGKDVYVSGSATHTDASGFADFDLPELGGGKIYVFKAQSTFDNRWLTSETVTQGGLVNFVVGNKLLNVAVTDGINNQPLANQEITVLRKEPDGNLAWFRRENTDANGRLNFDLPGLGSGTHYVLRTQQLYGTGTVFSGDIANTGNFDFRVGNLQVTVLDGANGQAIIGQDITVMEELIDGSLSWFARVPTDQNGSIPLHLPDLGQGRKYVLRAQTPLDKRWVNSDLIVNAGTFNFTVGNKLLNVTMLNALDGKGLANVEITAYERLPDQSLRWFQRKSTDAEGRIDFDLTDLGKGSSYVLRANPYGRWIDSKDIDKTGPFQFQAGAIAVKLSKAETGEVMPGHSLVLYEKGTDGRLNWRASLVTDNAGVVRFDPEGLGDGRLFVVRATNLFDNDKRHYSRWISQKGWVNFVVDPEDPDKLDDEPPIFMAFTPNNNANLADQGFQIRMKVTDNQEVDRVELTVIDPVAGTISGGARLDQGDWLFSVNNSMLTADQTVSINAVAFDKVGNSTSETKQYHIIKDEQAPQISVASHRSGDQIDEHGLALLGSVSDDTGVKSLFATVTDPIKGIIVNNRALEIGDNGHWGLAVRGLSRGGEVTVALSAEDWAGNRSVNELLLPVMKEAVSAAQLLSRTTFGATPELLSEIRTIGADAFLQKQLNPASIDDSELDTYLENLLDQDINDLFKLQYSQIARATMSKRQLLEVMARFWENHFNTDRSKTANDFEAAENEGFRTHALGRFRDLLGVSAKSPAMLLYLDNHRSHKNEPNENYARELLELHTLGVDNGYETQDIADVARVFTGWRLDWNSRAFAFHSWAHDNGEKTVLDTVIPAGSGMAGGEMVLDLLANHQSTAKNICNKLLKLLVSDQPAETSIQSCADDFIAYADLDNQIALVLEGIIRSPAFSASTNFHNKVKNPLEFTVGFFRQLPVTINHANTRQLMRGMGMHLFYYPAPTGWAEEADHWVNSGQMTQRWQFAGQALFNNPSVWRNYWEEPVRFFIDNGIETTEGVLAYIFELTMSHDYTQMEFETAKAVLTADNTERFDIYDDKADAKLRKAIALILKYPAYQLQ
ncbi:DUF1800 family protein, partial [Methylotuvimicrobium sp.]|uniref:DUF1800 family protein n=1 Tax=Methylotuvimicrobium sp. TaxID=2822413 RepID=UPI003D654CCD